MHWGRRLASTRPRRTFPSDGRPRTFPTTITYTRSRDVALPSCRRCGESDPRRMIALMTLWFGSFIDLEPAHGYFHLCPACFQKTVAPHLDDLQDTLARLNPAAAAYLERERDAGGPPGDAGGPPGDSGGDAT